MAKKTVRWTKTADQDKQRILKYRINRNKSTVFSEKLDILFDEAIEDLLIHPQLGKKSDFQKIRKKSDEIAKGKQAHFCEARNQ